MLNIEDMIDSPVLLGETYLFKNCIDRLQLSILKKNRWYYMFCNMQQDGSRVYSKNEWAFGNFKVARGLWHVEAASLSPGVSDHSPYLSK